MLDYGDAGRTQIANEDVAGAEGNSSEGMTVGEGRRGGSCDTDDLCSRGGRGGDVGVEEPRELVDRIVGRRRARSASG